MSKWYKASELERRRTLTPRDGVNGLPDNHIITVSERTIKIDERELVQNNVSTDTYTLELDAEWDDITPVVIFSNSEGDYKVAYENAPTKIPAAVMAVVGAVDVSVFGLDSTGAVRVVTKAAPNTMNVVESGKFVGEISEDDISLLGQILAAVEAANEAAENANATIIKSAVATTLNPGEPATANIADHVLTIGVPKGEKGDKGDPGQDGVTPFTQATVATLDPGTPATVSIAEDTLKLGIPKGDKGDKGDQGDKGETGDKGDPGIAATIAVGSVTGLDAGASPTVVNSGTATAARFDFGIPKGDKGDTGDPGHTPQRGVDYWTAEDVEAVVEDAKAQAVAELAEIGNVPKGTVTGLVAHTEDAYAAKPLEVRIKGRTVKNLWPEINGRANGFTVNTDGAGLVTVTGQLEVPTQGSYVSTSVTNVVVGRSITALCSRGLPDGVYLYVSFRDEGGTPVGYELQVGFNSTSETQKTALVPIGTVYALTGVAIKPGTTLEGSLTFRVMLVEGTEAPDCFVPTGLHSVEPGKLVTSGKNLLPQLSEWTPVNDTPSYGRYIENTLPIGTKVIAKLEKVVDNLGSNNVALYFCDKPSIGADSVKNYLLSFSSKPFVGDVISVPPTARYIVFHSSVNLSQVGIDFDIQLELGSTATAYEPPNVTTIPLPEVELRSLPNGTCDELVIGADGTATVERKIAEYQVQGRMVDYVGEHSNGQKYVAFVIDAIVSSSSSLLSDRYSCGSYNTIDKYAYIPDAHNLVINDSRFTDAETANSILMSEKPRFIFVTNQTTEPQSPVTLPTLPAPTFNQYHDSDVPSDTSATYTRDINIALADLEAQIADLVTKEAANV